MEKAGKKRTKAGIGVILMTFGLLLIAAAGGLFAYNARNDRIPGEEMTGKLSKQEEIVNKIFDQVKKDQTAARDLRKFMNYYLPTTEKLLKAYLDVDQQPISGDNIRNTKQEIEKAMDTVNEAFENLLDSLFEDASMDVISEISVMNTMMAQDGLTDKDKMK